jgi:hypothetical protein
LWLGTSSSWCSSKAPFLIFDGIFQLFDVNMSVAHFCIEKHDCLC